MNDSRLDRLFSEARAGRMSRRQLLETGLRLGLASPIILSLIEAAPQPAAAASIEAPVPAPAPARQSAGSTFTNITNTGVEDIDPHYSYSTLSSTVAMAVYEMLLQLKGDSTTEFAPMLAQSWEANADKSVYTFKLAPNAKFHDGTSATRRRSKTPIPAG